MRHLLRSTALLTGLTATSVLVATVAPAQAGEPTRPEQSAAWLAAQTTAGLVHSDQFGGFDDYGLTADVGLALIQLGGHQATVDEITAALAANVDNYTRGGGTDVYAGSTAKLLVFAQAAGADPTSYGGVNLVTRLNRQVSTDDRIKGRIHDTSGYGDYANVIGQSFAVQGLAAAGSGKTAPATGFLLKQQCSAGYFRLEFAKKAAKSQSCNGGNPATTSAPDTDATAFAVLALDSLPTKTTRVKDALQAAKKWLKSRQKANGSFGGGTSTEKSNGNSTGLAGWALGALGSCAEAQKAATWVVKWQVDTDAAPLAGELGALGYDKAAYDAAQTDGITGATRDQWRRTSAQAAPVLLDLVLADCRAR